MSDSRQPPILSKEQRLEEEILFWRERCARMDYELAKERLRAADIEAARQSLELTYERDQLATRLNTPEWRFDFERRVFVERGT